ncbi:MAG: OmpA family protein [Leptotrichiaceae bacterium]|nr:OmpA family protein [Leptotrichiaceae bacterium]MBP8637333.1 OmpA family protein [Leptotrichiaceae bacterium]MBP9539034.1 OmpA family protein [Leptotrichiaceae bacterium]
MKKLVILGTALLSLSLVASEIQIKGGYDFNRNQVSTSDTVLDFGNGATAGAEYIFDNQGEFEWGIGAEYKFDQKFKGNDTKWMRQIPVYALGKFNLVTTKKGNDVLYVLGRAGVALNESKVNGVKYDNGLYVAGGLGTEMGPVSLEAIYERAATPFTNARGFRTNDYQESFGLRLGLRLGNLVNDRTAKVTTVEKIVYVDKIVKVPGETVVTPPLNTKTVVLPFSCVATEKKCVIRGFKVDGRVPNAAEAKDLGTISSVINSFAKGGTVDFVGHTDSTGSDAYNQKLSVARAQNVARLLQEYGLSNDVKVGSISGKGETQPSHTNATVEGRYNNRRVELFFDNVDFGKVKFTN